MPGYHISDQHALRLVIYSIAEWIYVFTLRVYRDIVLDSLRYSQANKGQHVHALVIVSNHAHEILSTPEAEQGYIGS
jgi:hypothetical protein